MNPKHLLAVAVVISLLIGRASAASVKKDTNGNVVLTIDRETQQRIEIQVEALASVTYSPEVKGYGRVIDPSSLIALVSERAVAQVAYLASSNDLVRVKTLESQGNTSTHAVQTVEAAALRDQLAVRSAQERLTLSWGEAITEQKDLPAFIHHLTSREALLVRIDLPAGITLAAPPLAARIVSLSGNSAQGESLGAVSAMDPQMQGEGFIFLLKSSAPPLLFGEAVTGYFQMPGKAATGLAIPRRAVIRSQGAAWVYLQTGEEAFTRLEVNLTQPEPNGWFVTHGFSAGDKVVVNSPQLLLSEELKASITAGRD